MQAVLMFLLILIAIALVVLVLMQQGKGADVGAAFGSGASNTMFGSQGSTSFLFKLTLGLAIVFFIILITLTRMSSSQVASSSVINSLPNTQQTVDNKTNIPMPAPVKTS